MAVAVMERKCTPIERLFLLLGPVLVAVAVVEGWLL